MRVLQITDFGLSNIMSASNILRSKCGTPVYMGALAHWCNPPRAESHGGCCAAPEMLQNQPYDQSVDVWAAGILLYIMCAPLLPIQVAGSRGCLMRTANAQAERHASVLRGQP